MNYYNENDSFAAVWLRELIKAGHISEGEVDERSIEDVRPNDLRGYKQCHFFAGIGVWSYALRLAGWPDDRPVWTGSCPCQPFSEAGKRGGITDERHLWPAFYHLIRKCAPRNIFGEQVASKDGLAWFSTVSADLEAAGYAVGGVDLCSAGFGAPHIRQRLYFVGSRILANTEGSRRGVEHAAHIRSTDASRNASSNSGGSVADERRPDSCGGLANNNNTGLPERVGDRRVQPETVGSPAGQAPERGGLTNGFWANAEWIYCRDGKYRPIEPESSPLATGVTNRVGKLRGYGNALTAQVAKGFIESYLESA